MELIIYHNYVQTLYKYIDVFNNLKVFELFSSHIYSIIMRVRYSVCTNFTCTFSHKLTQADNI